MNDFTAYINPWLGKLLGKIRLDKDFQRAQGCYLYDDSGNRYLDCVSAYGALPFGHNPPEIWAAVRELEAQQVPNFIQPSAMVTAASLAKRLVELSPEGLDHVTFTNSGAEAVEAAIKVCRSATGRLGILSTRNSFHGKTLGALSATGNREYQDSFNAPVEGFAVIPYGDADALEQYLAQHGEQTAAFIVEPIQGEGGVVIPPPGYLSQVREICTRYGVPLVVDEIQTGLGRTGMLFACEQERVRPDVMLLAKALGGGLMPIGAVLISSKLYNEDYGMKHSSTFAGGSLACAAGLAALDLLTNNNGALVEQARATGEHIRSQLEKVCAPYDFVSVRGRGLMLGLEFNLDRFTHPHSMTGIMAEQKVLTPVIASWLLNVGKVRVAPTLNGSNVIRVQPPLTIASGQAAPLIDALEQLLPLLDQGDTAALFNHLVEPVGSPRLVRARTPRQRLAVEPDMTRFAFLIHPLDENSFAEFDPSMGQMSPAQRSNMVEQWQPELTPFVTGETVIQSRTSARAFCEFICIPRTAQQLLDMDPEESLDLVRQGVSMARERGARLVGLGAFTSVVSWGGMRLRDAGVPLTTGNSYTVVTASQATVQALNRLRINPAQTTVAVVGAAGSIGRCLALLMSETVEHLILLGNPANEQRSMKKMTQVAAEICQHVLSCAHRSPVAKQLLALGCPHKSAPLEQFQEFVSAKRNQLPLTLSTDADSLLPGADVIISATSSVSELITPDNVKFGAVVCDLSRPPNVSRAIRQARPDVLVIDGGVVEIPGRPDLGWNFGFEQGLGYACMAETMMLALEKHLEHTSIGSNLSLDTLTWIRSLAGKHGFRMADLRSFDKPLAEEDWQRVIAARSARRRQASQ